VRERHRLQPSITTVAMSLNMTRRQMNIGHRGTVASLQALTESARLHVGR